MPLLQVVAADPLKDDRSLAELASGEVKSTKTSAVVEDPTLLALTSPVPPVSSKASEVPEVSTTASSSKQSTSPTATQPKQMPDAVVLSDTSTGSISAAVKTPQKTNSEKAKVQGKKRKPVEEPETPEEKPKKILPEGCGGFTTKAMSCQICSRPRETDQRGSACPTCLQIMRGKDFNVRSISKVLADKALHDAIRSKCLEIKPIRSQQHEEHLRNTVSQVEKYLKELKRMV
eukprot:s189_g14.t1